MLSLREKAITLLGLRNAIVMSAPGQLYDEVQDHLVRLAAEQGISLELLNQVREEHQAWLAELGFAT
jgi:hypothetical protein